MSDRLSPTSSAQLQLTLRRLVNLRWLLLAGEVAALLVVAPWLDIALPRLPLLAVVGLQALFNGLAVRRLSLKLPFGEDQLLVQLIIDIVALSVLIFLSGGAANPLVSLLLPPVAIAALALSPRRVAIIAGLAVAAYSLLNVVYLPLPIADAGRAARLHLAGMWATFVVSVAMLAWFVVRLTSSIRLRDAELAAVAEQALRDERVIALAALAAGAAHELSTPLSTMAVVAGELESDASLGDSARADVALLRQQIFACKAIISGLAERAGAQRLDQAAAVDSVLWLSAVHGRWRQLRPLAASELHLGGSAPAPTIIADATLEQAVHNLLNNAADTGSAVRVLAAWDEDGLTVEVRDSGPGFAAHIIDQAGRAPFAAPSRGSGSGLGFGLFLAHSAITRLGGELTLGNDGGAVARIRLPKI
jgi:two-component system sensor histidine kinase RegB